MAYYAGIEAGGTKFVCTVGDGKGHNIEKCVIKTTTPEATLTQVCEFFDKIAQTYPLSAIGIGAFGPIDAEPDSDTYGYILHTPKKAWINCDIVGFFKQHYDLPIGFETDVNVAALGEYEFGAAKHIYNFLYMTVGTGIGAAAMLNGNIIRGMSFSEMGHMLIPHDKQADSYEGICPYHGDCLEGLACGGAIKDRWQVASALDLPSDHPAWELEADYLSAGLVNVIMILSPQKIILGGGVMHQQHLLPMVRKKVLTKINDYITTKTLQHDIDNYIIAPGLADGAGINGAVALARRVHEKTRS